VFKGRENFRTLECKARIEIEKLSRPSAKAQHRALIEGGELELSVWSPSANGVETARLGMNTSVRGETLTGDHDGQGQQSNIKFMNHKKERTGEKKSDPLVFRGGVNAPRGTEVYGEDPRILPLQRKTRRRGVFVRSCQVFFG